MILMISKNSKKSPLSPLYKRGGLVLPTLSKGTFYTPPFQRGTFCAPPFPKGHFLCSPLSKGGSGGILFTRRGNRYDNLIKD